MGKEFKTIALLGRYEDPRVAEPMALLAGHLTAAGLRVIAGPTVAPDLDLEARAEE